MRVSFKSEIELPEEHTVNLLILLNTFYVNKNPVRRLQFSICSVYIRIPGLDSCKSTEGIARIRDQIDNLIS